LTAVHRRFSTRATSTPSTADSARAHIDSRSSPIQYAHDVDSRPCLIQYAHEIDSLRTLDSGVRCDIDRLSPMLTGQVACRPVLDQLTCLGVEPNLVW